MLDLRLRIDPRRLHHCLFVPIERICDIKIGINNPRCIRRYRLVSGNAAASEIFHSLFSMDWRQWIGYFNPVIAHTSTAGEMGRTVGCRERIDQIGVGTAERRLIAKNGFNPDFVGNFLQLAIHVCESGKTPKRIFDF